MHLAHLTTAPGGYEARLAILVLSSVSRLRQLLCDSRFKHYIKSS